MIQLGKQGLGITKLLEDQQQFLIGKYSCKAVRAYDDSWHLAINGWSNDQLFKDLHIDKVKFCEANNIKIVKPDGIFPYMSQQDLTRAVRILRNLYQEAFGNPTKSPTSNRSTHLDSGDKLPF